MATSRSHRVAIIAVSPNCYLPQILRSMAKILLVEDEAPLAELVAEWLAMSNHDVKILADGHSAMREIRTFKNAYEVLILDIVLPGHSGLEICRAYREAFGYAPILIISAKDAISVKESAFQYGADDYLTKPFHLKELTMRVEALLRRSYQPATSQWRFRDIILDQGDRRVTKAGEEIHLSPQEFRILEFFFKNPNKVFSSDELLRRLWESEDLQVNDTVRGHIKKLRRKLDTRGNRSVIRNIYGVGYKMETREDELRFG